MNNQSFLTVLTIPLNIAGWSSESFARKTEVLEEKTRPNIVVMIADDCTYRDLGCYGSKNSKTPNIDSLARQGIMFTNFFQASPMSSPTRHCLMTGLYPVKSGAYPNHTFAKEGTRSVVHYLKELGYRVALQGKRHIAPESIFNFEYLSPGAADVDTSRIRPFIEDATLKQEPFCLFVCSHQPHTPWNKGDTSIFQSSNITLPPYYVDTPETRDGYIRYLAEINYMDTQVGEVMSLLEKTGTDKNTIVFFTSEQGNSLPFAKWTCYDMGVQTGMIVRWPGVIEEGSICNALAEYVDVTPTLIDIAGGLSPDNLDGRSFKSLLMGNNEEFKSEVYAIQTTRGTINGSDHFGIRSVRNKRYVYIKNLTPEAEFSCAMTSIKDPIWASWLKAADNDSTAKYLVDKYIHRPSEELYDRIKDPDQKTNLAGKKRYRKIQKRLSEKLDTWMVNQGDKGQETEMEATEHQVRNKGREAGETPLFLADPYIFEENGVFYAYGTFSRNGITVYRSLDMKTWEGPCGKASENLALHKDDSWGNRNFWAPEVYRYNGRYIMTYSADQRIAIAFSDSPLGPFIQEKPFKAFTPDQNSIDSHIFIDDDGQAYLYWVRFGLGKGNEIRVARLSQDLTEIVSSQTECLHSTPGTWEVTEPEHRVCEGPFVLKHDGKYYLSFSCNHFKSCDYAVGYAVSDSPMGPWERYKGNPILIRHDGLCGTGHHAFFRRSDGKLFIVYHAHHDNETVAPRKMIISPCKFIENGDSPDIITVGEKAIQAYVKQ